MEQTTLRVDGMACDGCEANVTGALESIAGVAAVTADHETGEVRIEHDETTVDRVTLANTVDNAGYRVEE